MRDVCSSCGGVLAHITTYYTGSTNECVITTRVKPNTHYLWCVRFEIISCKATHHPSLAGRPHGNHAEKTSSKIVIYITCIKFSPLSLSLRLRSQQKCCFSLKKSTIFGLKFCVFFAPAKVGQNGCVVSTISVFMECVHSFNKIYPSALKLAEESENVYKADRLTNSQKLCWPYRGR